MKIDVTYGLVKNALIVNVFCQPENKSEKPFCDDLSFVLKKKIELMINNTDSDDGNHLRGINFTKETKSVFEKLIKQLIIKEITENYENITDVGLKMNEVK
jgi:hypothetical protein